MIMKLLFHYVLCGKQVFKKLEFILVNSVLLRLTVYNQELQISKATSIRNIKH